MLIDNSNNQNIETQVFIIKQIERKNKKEFETKYANFLGSKKNFISNSIVKGTADFFNNFTSKMQDRKKSYLVPLIYDVSNYENTQLESVDIISNTTTDGYFYTEKDKKTGLETEKQINNTNLFFNTNFNSIKKCPLLDFTKLSYIFQTTIDNFLGISDVTSFNVSLDAYSGSSATISLDNFNYKYNFIEEDISIKENIKFENLYQSVFDTNDIVILRVSKRSNRDNSLVKNIDLYSNGAEDYFQTVFTGFINNVSEETNWNSKSQSLTISCSGPSKVITYSRLITGQATADLDYGSAIVPISVYNIPQARQNDGTFSLENKDMVKNVIARSMTAIDNIPECHKAKEKFNKAFVENFNSAQNNNDNYKNIANSRKEYNNAIFKHFESFIDNTFEKAGIYDIYTNVFKKENKNQFLPVFHIEGTNQPGAQYVFNTFNNLFVSNYNTVYQFIKQIADKIGFVFYDDQYGVIHFEKINTNIRHLFDENDPNNFTQVISFSKNQNTDLITNIMPVFGEGEYANILNGQAIGLGAVVRNAISIKKYGERPMSPINVTGIIDKKACERYGLEMMDKMNRKINSYSLSIIGDPSIKLGKYGYFRDYKKLFYVEKVNHSYSAGSNLSTSIVGSYERNIILSILDVNNPFKAFKINEETAKNLKNKSPYTKFLYIRNYVNGKNIDEYYNAIDELMKETINSESGEIIKKQKIKLEQSDILTKEAKEDISKKLISNQSKNYYYIQENGSEMNYIKEQYSTEQVSFLYFDGYFWNNALSNDLYKEAYAIQQESIKQKLMKENQKKLEEKKKAKKQKNIVKFEDIKSIGDKK